MTVSINLSLHAHAVNTCIYQDIVGHAHVVNIPGHCGASVSVCLCVTSGVLLVKIASVNRPHVQYQLKNRSRTPTPV